MTSSTSSLAFSLSEVVEQLVEAHNDPDPDVDYSKVSMIKERPPEMFERVLIVYESHLVQGTIFTIPRQDVSQDIIIGGIISVIKENRTDWFSVYALCLDERVKAILPAHTGGRVRAAMYLETGQESYLKTGR